MGSYRERLLVPVSYWLLAVPSIAFLGAEAWFIAGGIVPPLTLAIISLIAAVFLINWGSATIEVTGEVLRTGRDTLLLSEAGEILPLDEKQAVQVGAQWLIGGGQPGGERRGRPGRHAGRAEEITDGDPLPDEPLDSGVFRGRIVGVQPLEGGEPGIGRREQAGVERAETA